MPRIARELSAAEIKKLSKPGFHSVGSVAGLALKITPSGAKHWVLRIVHQGKRRDFGLGGYPSVSLATAREQSRLLRVAGPNKVTEQQPPTLPEQRSPLFSEAAECYVTTYSPSWRNKKHAQQWTNTLRTYVYPVIGGMRLSDIATEDILKVLRPIWHSKTETASRVRGRIEQVLAWGHAQGYCEAKNPARWQGLLDKLLPNPHKIAPHRHHRAIHFDEIQPFYNNLRNQPGVAPRALEMVLLTAARSGEVRGMRWEEIDHGSAVWTVPASRMKSGRQHRVPLSRAATDLLARMLEGQECREGLVFKSKRGGQLSDMSLTAVMRRMTVDAVPHGFRSTFRDWVAERTDYPNELAEMALAHVISNKTEAAYRRGDMLKRRRELMNEWALYLTKQKTCFEDKNIFMCVSGNL